MKVISWNVNGLNAIMKKDFNKIITNLNVDVICIQETKISTKIQNAFLPNNYHHYFNFSQRTGYSGVAIFSKKEPVNVLFRLTSRNCRRN